MIARGLSCTRGCHHSFIAGVLLLLGQLVCFESSRTDTTNTGALSTGLAHKVTAEIRPLAGEGACCTCPLQQSCRRPPFLCCRISR